MRTIKFLSTLAAITLVAVFFVRCTEDAEPAEPVVNYGISGTVTYPDFNGTATPAGGAVVYLKMDATEATTNYDLVTVADASGNYSFVELTDGTHFVFANYDSDNTNNGRMAGVIFGGEGALVTVEGEVAAQDLALVSMGQTDAFSVNTFEGGVWLEDWHHSNVEFAFPYDGGNATYTGRFLPHDIYVDFDPNSLGTSKIEATIDVLTVITDSPGGRDPLYSSDGTLAVDEEGLYNLGCIHGTLGMENDNPESANRYSTFVSTSIVAYGDGYLATADFTVNGVTAEVNMFFKFIPGFQAEDRSGVLHQYSSFQGSFDFAPFQVFGISSGHIGEENDATIDVSFQVLKPL